MKVRWSGVESVCREVATVAGGGLACWVEDSDGNVLVGTRDDSDRPARHPVHLDGQECGTACVVGPDSERWAQFAASTLSRELGYKAAFTPAVARWVATRGFSPEFGARELRRVIQREVEPRLSELMLEEAWDSEQLLRVRVREGDLDFSIEG